MTVVVIGDVMLDVYEEGVVERISPEAPVPVLHNPRGYAALGGAANTAQNISALGHRTSLVGLIGDDAAAERCRRLAVDGGLVDGLVSVPAWRTIVKHRFIASGQQMLRVDTEDSLPASASEALGADIASWIDDATAVVLSDYDKGAVTQRVVRKAIDTARRRGIPVVVDSKRIDPGAFRGCTVIAPNRMEATRMTGSADPREASKLIAEKTRSAVAVTLGPDGLLLYSDGEVLHVHSQAREVADVTGAGDSVTAGLAVALVEGKGLPDAARFATAVAAVAVAHRGTYAVKRADIL